MFPTRLKMTRIQSRSSRVSDIILSDNSNVKALMGGKTRRSAFDGACLWRRAAECSLVFVTWCLLISVVSASGGSSSSTEAVPKKVLRVVTLFERPYMMNNTEDPDATGNDRFLGFLKDVLDEIADKVGFEYTLYLAPDGLYGAFNQRTQQWTGMVGEVATGKADIAANALTITSARHLSVDITKPFLFTGLSILYKHPTRESAGGSAFLMPFTSGAWLSVLGMYIFVACSLWLVARCSPSERKRTDTAGDSKFTIANSFWFTLSSLVLRGTESYPKSLSTRLITFIWWVYSMILLVLYATLVAEEYATARAIPKINHWRDLLNQDYVEYGCVEGGSTQKFFETSQITEYRQMGEKMKKNPSWMSSSYAEGMQRVEESDGRYAFIMETTMADYVVHRNCNLTKIGPEIHRRSYGLALKKGSPLTHPVSNAILELQEQGAMQALYMKWWHDTSENCQPFRYEEHIYTLDATHLSGIFVGLTLCLIITLAIALLEVVWYSLWGGDLSKPFSTRLTLEIRQIVGLDPPSAPEHHNLNETT